MSLIRCGECGKEVSDAATSCPGCGAPRPKSAPAKRRSLVWPLLGFLVVAGIIGGQFAKQQAEQRLATATPQERQAREESIARQALAMTLKNALVKAAREPDSLRIDSMRTNSAGTIACAEFRGRNAAGGISNGIAVYALGKSSIGDTKAWNQHCLGSMLDMRSFIR